MRNASETACLQLHPTMDRCLVCLIASPEHAGHANEMSRARMSPAGPSSLRTACMLAVGPAGRRQLPPCTRTMSPCHASPAGQTTDDTQLALSLHATNDTADRSESNSTYLYIYNRDIGVLLLIISSKLHIGPWALHATAAAARTGPDQNAVERARAASMATPTTATGAAGFGPCTRADGAASCRPAEPRMGGYTTT
jgi:hypothetical protein